MLEYFLCTAEAKTVEYSVKNSLVFIFLSMFLLCIYVYVYIEERDCLLFSFLFYFLNKNVMLAWGYVSVMTYEEFMITNFKIKIVTTVKHGIKKNVRIV